LFFSDWREILSDYSRMPPTARDFVNALKAEIAKYPGLRYERHTQTHAIVSGTGNTFVQYEPLPVDPRRRATGPIHGVYVYYGTTAEANRGKGLGTTLRKIGRNASHILAVPLYQVSQNLESLNPGGTPISGKIMKKLGAVSASRIPGKTNVTREERYKYKIMPSPTALFHSPPKPSPRKTRSVAKNNNNK
jgi:hypothetical protein